MPFIFQGLQGALIRKTRSIDEFSKSRFMLVIGEFHYTKGSCLSRCLLLAGNFGLGHLISSSGGPAFASALLSLFVPLSLPSSISLLQGCYLFSLNPWA
jgi:hypothetical protein